SRLSRQVGHGGGAARRRAGLDSGRDRRGRRRRASVFIAAATIGSPSFQQAMEIFVNGAPRALPDDLADPALPLLWALRDLLGLTCTKFGCGVGACGACTVLVDGQATRSCVLPIAQLRGRRVVTI